MNRRQILICFSALWIAAIFLCAPAIASGIHEAAKNGDMKTVKGLLAEDPTLRRSIDDSKRSPLHWAALRGRTDMMALTYDRKVLESPDFIGFTPLFLAIMADREAVRWLLDKGADFHAAAGTAKITPLHWAAERGKPGTTALLIERGADLEATNLAGTTPLMTAAKEGRTDTASVLLEKGANVEAANFSGATPLMMAAAFGREGVVREILKHKPDVNRASLAGITALHLAAKRGAEAVARLLLAAGADPNIRDKKGETPYEKIPENGSTSLRALLE